MAITYVNSQTGTTTVGGGGSVTIPYTNAANPNSVLIFVVGVDSGGLTNTATFDGVSMTAFQTGIYTVGFIIPLSSNSIPAGSNNLVWSPGTGLGSNLVSYAIYEYQGVFQSTTPDASAVTTGTNVTSLSQNITTVSNNALVLGIGTCGPGNPNTNLAQSTGMGNNQASTSTRVVGGDSGIEATGGTVVTQKITCSSGSGKQVNLLSVSLAPAIVVNLSLSFMNADSREATVSAVKSAIVNLSLSIMNSASRYIYLIHSFWDSLCTVVTSAYKWLTSTLFAAQQNFSVQPYFTCQILDDTIVPTQIYSPPGTPIQGSVVTAPDGNLLAAGLDTNNHLSFWKIPNGTILSQWETPTTVLSTNPTLTDPTQSVSIAVSNFINGTYCIDVYAFQNYGVSGNNLQIVWFRSTNGGTTWSSGTVINSPTILSISTPQICLSAGTPVLLDNGTISGIVFYVKPTGTSVGWTGSNAQYTMAYQYYGGSGSFGAETLWGGTVNSQDFTLHSLDNFYNNGIYYIIFSGLHNLLETPGLNYSLYLTSLANIQSNVLLDKWTAARNILISTSSATTNNNSYTYPKLSFDGTNLYLLFKAVTASSIVGSTVTAVNNYMLMISQDFVNFSYPTPIVFTDGVTALTGTYGYNFVYQGSNYFIAGAGALWQYVKNYTLADVSLDVLSYTIQETSGQPSSITLQIGNQNGQWYGSSPTNPGYQAIAKNKKILLNQGYYNANDIAEVVPRNVFFIDDIQQNVTSTNNDLTIVGRDLWKKLATTTSQLTFNYVGPQIYTDLFDGSTLSNWNQNVGTWNEVGSNGLGYMTCSTSSGTDQVITLSNILNNTEKYDLFVAVQLPDPTVSGQFVHVYAFYQDVNNWLRLRIGTNGVSARFNIAIQTNIAGTITNQVSLIDINIGYIAGSATQLPILIKQYGFFNYDFIVGTCNNTGGNGQNSLDPSVATYIGTYSAITQFITAAFTTGAVGFGINTFTTSAFRYFKFIQYSPSQSIRDLSKTIANICSVFPINTEKLFNEYFYNPAFWTGTFTTPNRWLTITAGNLAMYNQVQIANGEVSFTAKVNETAGPNNFGFSFYFRSGSLSNSYTCYEIALTSNITGGNRFVRADLYLNTASNARYLINTSSFNAYSSTDNNEGLNIDLTQFHTYKVVFSGQNIYLFIDGEAAIIWVDNNTNQQFTNGYVGFAASTGSTLVVSNVYSPYLFDQVATFAINTGDELDQSLLNLLQTELGYAFSNMMGILSLLILQDTDLPNYTYQNQLYAQVTDQSDKEYVNQVTVNGQNVTVTIQDTASIASTGQVRNMVITDYTILTYQAALSRATSELINADQYNSQYNPKQINNLGSELYDVVIVINTGPNSSNVSTTTRIYGQVITTGGVGSNVEYSLEIETGSL